VRRKPPLVRPRIALRAVRFCAALQHSKRVCVNRARPQATASAKRPPRGLCPDADDK